MDSYQHKNTLQQFFFNPLHEVYFRSDHQFDCPVISDIDYLMMGITRCIESEQSGNGFLQYYRKENGQKVEVGHFFEAIKSKRRLTNITSVNHLLGEYMKRNVTDELASIDELKKWQIFAADGHYHQAALFDAKTKADTSAKEPSKTPTGHFFRINMRNHYLDYLDLAQPKDGKKSEHDMKMLKRQNLEDLRTHAIKGQKVLYVWDKACIDYGFWMKAKSQKGIYFSTLEKSNSSAKTIRTHTEIDYTDKRNDGIYSDEIVATSGGYELRRIIYTNPADGNRYSYLTNDLSLPAWVHVLVYKHRWDIEKTFDTFKTKLNEKRSWASSITAKKTHALFLCLTHNLMLIQEEHFRHNEGLSDKIEEKKKQIREKTRVTGSAKKYKDNFINTFFQRASQRTFRYVRWLRNSLRFQVSYEESLIDLAYVWGGKLT